MDLNKWADDNSTFLKIESGQKVQCVFVRAEEVPDSFNPDKTKIRYTFSIDGNNKTFDSASTKLANEIAKIKQGEIIEILRQGEGMKTQYQVKVIIGKKEPNKIKNKPDAITDEDLDDLDKNINKK